MKQVVSSNSPMTWARAVYAQPQVPKWDYESRKGPVAHTTARRVCQDDIKHYPWDMEDTRVEIHQYSTCDISHASCDVMHSHIEKDGESFGIGVSANAKNSTSAKYLTSTIINRCNGERGWHNYRPNYSSSEPDYSSDEMLYEAPYETLYEAPYETSDHGSSPPAWCSACSLREDLEYSLGEVKNGMHGSLPL